MDEPLEPPRRSPAASALLVVCGAVGGLLGGTAAAFLMLVAINVYLSVWDTQPGSHGYHDPLSGLPFFLGLIAAIFLLGAALGGFAAVKLGRRMCR